MQTNHTTVNTLTNLHLAAGMALWASWSVLVVLLAALDGSTGTGISHAELFKLVAISGVSATMLQLGGFFIGERAMRASFIYANTMVLIIPALLLAWALNQQLLQLNHLQWIALACGAGGAQFIALQQPNQSAQMGWQMAVNAAIVGIGIVVAQVLAPLLVTIPSGFAFAHASSTSWGTMLGSQAPNTPMWLANIGWAAAIILALLTANKIAKGQALKAKKLKCLPLSTNCQPIKVLRNRHTWFMTLLFIMAFGSFIGFAMAFPLSVQAIFATTREWQGGELIEAAANHGAPNALTYAWLGPLCGILARPIGGWLADSYGGAKVTWWCALILATSCLLAAQLSDWAYYSATPERWFLAYILVFMLIFSAAGAASSAVCRSITQLFPAEQASYALRWVLALGTAGAAYIPWLWSLTDQPGLALVGFSLFYLICATFTRITYLRRHSVHYNP